VSWQAACGKRVTLTAVYIPGLPLLHVWPTSVPTQQHSVSTFGLRN
jgi:hypothetical protein